MGAAGLGSRAIIGRFFARLQQDAGSWIKRVARLMNSDQESETYKWLGQSPAMREWVGGRHAKGFRENGITVINKHYEATMDIPLSWIRRDKTGQIDIRVAEMVQRGQAHWMKLLSTLIVNGTGSTSGLCYDGQYFFDSDHSEGDSGTQKNLLTSTEVGALNVTTAANPTAAESAKAILGVIAYMLTYADDQGEPMNENAREFLVMAAPALWGYLVQGAVQPVVGSGETNVIASLRADGFNISIAANARMTSTTVFNVFRTDAPAAALIMQQETELQMKEKAENTDYEFDNDAWQFGIDTWRNVAYGYWQYGAHATLS